MSMDDESRRAMIAYRQEKADIALDDADFLAESGRYSLAANLTFLPYICKRNVPFV